MYVRIKSWHRVTRTSRAGAQRTRCGRWAGLEAPEAVELPLGERSCETCLRLDAHDQRGGEG